MNRFTSLPFLFAFLTLSLGACAQQTPTTSHGGPVRNHVSLIDQLRAYDATVTPTGVMAQPFFSVKGQAITVNGEHVQVYEYPTADAANAESARISPDGGTVGNTHIDWVASPHFYQEAR